MDRFQDIAAGMRSRVYEGIFQVHHFSTKMLPFKYCCASVLKRQLCDRQRRTGDTRDGCAMFWKSKRYE